MIGAVDPNLDAAADSFTGYLTDNGPLVVTVVSAIALFSLGIRWVSRLARGKSPV